MSDKIDLVAYWRKEGQFLEAAAVCGDNITVEYAEVALATADEIETLRSALAARDETIRGMREALDHAGAAISIVEPRNIVDAGSPHDKPLYQL